ncbi:MAG TPA: chorismate-binding protein, partial [Candidatus Berkiella sp.]|nr:chorismate-binding protein [Candidatus Berkiella sp.]
MDHFPLVEELVFQEPLACFIRLPREGALWLDSAATSEQGRYSYIAFSPFQTIISKNELANPWTVLEAVFARYSLTSLADLPPFQGGMAGVFGYELGGYLEKLPRSSIDDLQFPELMVGCYDLVLAFDHSLQRCWLFSSGFPEIGDEARLTRAKRRLAYAKDLLSQTVTLPAVSSTTIAPEAITSTFTQTRYEEEVARVIEYIRAGDIFEANISQRFSCTLPDELSSFDLYRRLRKNN